MGPVRDSFLFRRFQLPDDLAGRPQHQRSGRYFGSRRHESLCANDGTLPDLRAVENDRAHADKDLVSHRAGMHDGAVPHRDQLANESGKLVRNVHDRAILDVAARAHRDPVDIAPQDRAEPDAGFLA